MPRLATRVWVQAQVRLCDRHVIPIAVTRRGDPDAGTVIVRLLRADGNLLLRRHTQLDGSVGWMPAADGPLDDEASEAYIGREVDRDPDIWVIEVDDLKGRYWPDREIED